MRTLSKVVLIIVIITLLYSVAKLINAKSNKNQQQITVKTATMKQNNQSIQTNQNTTTQGQTSQSEKDAQTTNTQNTQQVPATPDKPNAQGLYQADDILIDGQGKAGSNYIDITSDTPITPQPQNNTQGNSQNNNYNSSGGAYAEASVNIDNNNTSAQQYAPGVPAFEVADGY